MSRYRPPQPPKAPYITPEGAQRLTKELSRLWKEERPQVTATVHEAAKNGDRSENGDYIYGKKRLREIDGRVRYLSKRLDELTIVDRIPADQSKIYFGAWVTLLKNDHDELKVRLVGPDEIDPGRGYISVDSPLAKQLIGKTLDDEAFIETDSESACYEVIKIVYQQP